MVVRGCICVSRREVNLSSPICLLDYLRRVCTLVIQVELLVRKSNQMDWELLKLGLRGGVAIMLILWVRITTVPFALEFVRSASVRLFVCWYHLLGLPMRIATLLTGFRPPSD